MGEPTTFRSYFRSHQPAQPVSAPVPKYLLQRYLPPLRCHWFSPGEILVEPRSSLGPCLRKERNNCVTDIQMLRLLPEIQSPCVHSLLSPLALEMETDGRANTFDSSLPHATQKGYGKHETIIYLLDVCAEEWLALRLAIIQFGSPKIKLIKHKYGKANDW